MPIVNGFVVPKMNPTSHVGNIRLLRPVVVAVEHQKEECDRLAGVLYTKGLTQEQVGDVFEQIYGQHYSKSSISRMVDSVRTQVNEPFVSRAENDRCSLFYFLLPSLEGASQGRGSISIMPVLQ